MKRKECEIKHSQSEELCVESERPNDEPMSKDLSRVPRKERLIRAIMSRFSSVATP